MHGHTVLGFAAQTTAALLSVYRMEQDSRRAAAIYEIPVADVEAAIHYEQHPNEQRLAA
ncbi:MAG TPA: hypothetical protein PKY50_11680 [Candidatus Competibacter sp.]|nr:hypothetical protein [Candidatus Competibacter sp.]